MAIAVETPSAKYTGNDATTVFPFDFTFSNTSDVVVYLDGVVQTAGYVVNDEDVTFAVAPGGVSVEIHRETPLDQPAPFSDPQTASLEEIGVSLDRATRQIQEVDDAAETALEVAEGLEDAVIDAEAAAANAAASAASAQAISDDLGGAAFFRFDATERADFRF